MECSRVEPLTFFLAEQHAPAPNNGRSQCRTRQNGEHMYSQWQNQFDSAMSLLSGECSGGAYTSKPIPAPSVERTRFPRECRSVGLRPSMHGREFEPCATCAVLNADFGGRTQSYATRTDVRAR